METLLIDWFSLLFRFLHVVTAIAWIGASFYFVWLDNSLETPPDWKKEKGVFGDLWAFHGGGIYEVAKYSLAPPTMPKNLHWFKWEAYSTWITGSLLLFVLYYLQADLYLVKPNGPINSALATIAVSVLFLVSGFAFYETALRVLNKASGYAFLAVMVIFVVFMSWLATTVFSARAAYLHVGALLATIMAANVFFGIMPAQRSFIDAINRDEQPDSARMLGAKTRSIHNNYFTLPVIICMISNHYPLLYGHTYNWVLLTIILLTSAYARHFFNLRHRNIVKPQILVISFAVFFALFGVLAWEKSAKHVAIISTDAPTDASIDRRVETIIANHCAGCHSANPSLMGFTAAPAGIIIDSIDSLLLRAEQASVAIESQYMPLGNVTQMSDEERQLLLHFIATKTAK